MSALEQVEPGAPWKQDGAGTVVYELDNGLYASMVFTKVGGAAQRSVVKMVAVTSGRAALACLVQRVGPPTRGLLRDVLPAVTRITPPAAVAVQE